MTEIIRVRLKPDLLHGFIGFVRFDNWL